MLAARRSDRRTRFRERTAGRPLRYRDALGRRRAGAPLRGRDLRCRRRRRAARARAGSGRPRRRGAARAPSGRHLRRLGAERLPAEEPAPLPRRTVAGDRPDAPAPLLAGRPARAPRRLRRAAAALRVQSLPPPSPTAGPEHHRVPRPEVPLNGLRDPLVRVPPPTAEERRLEPRLPEPRSLPADTSRRATGDCHVTVTAGRTGLVRSAPVGVVAERAELRGAARPLEPERLVLAGLGVRRPHERRDAKAARPRRLERLEPTPDAIGERPFDVARDHGVPFLPGHERGVDSKATLAAPPSGRAGFARASV